MKRLYPKRIICFTFLFFTGFILEAENIQVSGSVEAYFSPSTYDTQSPYYFSVNNYIIDNYLKTTIEMTFLPFETSYAFLSGELKLTEFLESETGNLFQSVETSINEAFISASLSDFLFLNLGKKRIVWGVAYFENPSDFINPPKNPADPEAEKRGVYCAEIELILAILSINQVVTISDEFNSFGYGTKISTSSLIPYTDINGVYYYSSNALHNIGFSVDTAPFTEVPVPILEETAFHGEIGFHQRSPNFIVQSGMLGKKPDLDYFYITCAAGLRIMVPVIDTYIVVEYIYRQDGYSPQEFKDVIDGGFAANIVYSPTRMGRHLLAISLTQPKLSDYFWDVTDTLALNVVYIINIEDQSSMIRGEIESSFVENASIKLFGGTSFGNASSEFGIMPVAGYWGASMSIFF